MTEALSTFDFVAYTGLPQEAASQSRKVVRRRAMLDFRQKERHQEKKKDNDDSSWKKCLGDTIQTSWASSARKSFLNEIVETDPFDAFEVKIEPYVLDLLASCSSTILLQLRIPVWLFRVRVIQTAVHSQVEIFLYYLENA